MADNITHKDLSEVKEKFYSEIKDCRHGWKNEAQKQVMVNDEYGKDIALLKQSRENADKVSEDMKSDMKEHYWDMKKTFAKFLEDIDKKFATKWELALTNMWVKILIWVTSTWWTILAWWLIWQILNLI